MAISGNPLIDALTALLAGMFIVVLQHMLRTRGARNVLRKDLDILAALPKGQGRDALEKYVDQQALRLADRGVHERRDPSGMTLGLIFLGIGSWLFTLGWEGSGLWYLAAGPFLLFGLYGTVESANKARRDERGRRIKNGTEKAAAR